MSELVISKKNEVYLRIECDPHIKYELSDHFTFDVPEAVFMPSYRNKHWDGKIRLFSPHTGEIYCGLLDRVITWCSEMNYSMKFESNKYYGGSTRVKRTNYRTWCKRIHGIYYPVRSERLPSQSSISGAQK